MTVGGGGEEVEGGGEVEKEGEAGGVGKEGIKIIFLQGGYTTKETPVVLPKFKPVATS